MQKCSLWRRLPIPKTADLEFPGNLCQAKDILQCGKSTCTIEKMSDVKIYHHPEVFLLDSGKQIENLKISYHTYGKVNAEKSNIIWVFHSISANSDVLDWWAGLFGSSCLYDPKEYFIICANTIGSPYGSSRPVDLEFPQFTVRDVVRAHLLLTKELKIGTIHTAIGGSFGGAQALEFAHSFWGVIDHLILVASSSRESAWGIAIHESQRLALTSDPSFGAPEGGESGMKAARSMAMLTYRTSDAFISQQTDGDEKLDDFMVSSYIQYQGEKFVKRFNALSYYYLTKCLDSHNIGRSRGGEANVLRVMDVPTLVIGIDSDVLIPTRFQKFIAENMPKGSYQEIHSDFGHDGFLIETQKITQKISDFYLRTHGQLAEKQRKVLKFGGKSLTNGSSITRVIDIINKEAKEHCLAIVVSARGKSTDQLIELYELARKGKYYNAKLEVFFKYQEKTYVGIDLKEKKKQLSETLKALASLKTEDNRIKDRILSIGEVIGAKTVVALLKSKGLEAIYTDARNLIFTKPFPNRGDVDVVKTKKCTIDYFNRLKSHQIPVITGFIAADENGETITLGRNGTNYSATLIANAINAKEVQNWTDVDGIYSASPEFVTDPIRIAQMNYKEANELAAFGTNVLHPKTILPLMQSNIPLRIKSSANPDAEGTLIDKDGSGRGIKAISVINNVSLVCIEGQGLSGTVGIDAKIFTVLSKNNISVRLISQASSERGIGFVINQNEASKAELLLYKEFEEEIRQQHVSDIQINNDIAVISIIGRHNYSLEKAIGGLRKNKIWMYLISNSISGEHISLVVNNKHLQKAVNVVHNQVFGVIKTLNLFAFGKGTVGGELLNQITQTGKTLVDERNLEIKIIGVADTQRMIIDEKGLGKNWRKRLAASKEQSDFTAIMSRLKTSGIENIVIADNTASQFLTEKYPSIIKYGFDIVASNKRANSISYEFYANLRKEVKQQGKLFFYETNVGAGLPIIDTLKHLYQSSDLVTRIKGVFSGSLSYLFNNFSVRDTPFSEILIEASDKGFTEPDPREDLKGLDMARKLIILAREIGMKPEFEEVEVENLIPEHLSKIEKLSDFMERRNELDAHFEKIKSGLGDEEVLRYTGDLDTAKGKLKVSLVRANKNAPLGGIRNTDAIFEIYTKNYGKQPIIVQGAGAGAKVTAHGVYSDILRVGMLH